MPGGDEFLAILKAAQAADTLEQQTCLSIAEKGDQAGAVRRLKSDLMKYPSPPNPFFYDPILDIDFQTGNYADAYQVAAAVLRTQRPTEVKTLLKASLAAAMMGEVYKGQRDLCLKVLNPPGVISQVLPKGDSPAEVGCLSCLTLQGDQYLELALKLQPGDPFASFLLGSKYNNDCRYSKAISVLEAGQSKAEALEGTGPGSLYTWFDSLLPRVRWAFSKYGDGNPKQPPAVATGAKP